MVKQKESRRLGIMSKSEYRFLYLEDEEKKKYVTDVMQRKHYQRITEGANEAFRDIVSMIIKLPPNQVKKIKFEAGLNNIHRHLSKKHLDEREPYQAIETAQLSLKACLEIISKYNPQLKGIASADFDLVEKWLYVAQKFPEPQGATL